MKYGLIGEHLGHSFSKIIHEMVSDYIYELKEIQPNDVESFMLSKEFKALNVTIPYKQTVIPYLDAIDEKAKSIGAVNTIVNREGKLFGFNTDYDGIVALLRRNNVDPKGKNVLILGTGGTSNTAFAVFSDLGAASVVKVSRTGKNGAITYEEAIKQKGVHIIFNATPSGMFPKNDDCPISLDSFTELEAVLDAIYNPLRTRLVVEAKNRGIIADGGLYMLVAQAVYAIEHFLSIKLDESLIDEIYDKILRQKENLVLIGMPGCGKSTIARELSSEYVDTDEMLVKKIGNISDFILSNGEQVFRDHETETVKEASKFNGAVISTGGGVVLRKENIDSLKQNGKIIYLYRDLEKLQVGGGRPLSADFESLKRRYEERKDLYIKYSDAVVDNNRTIEETIKEIKKL